jgi:peptide/nickel transport system substrate-binding protein
MVCQYCLTACKRSYTIPAAKDLLKRSYIMKSSGLFKQFVIFCCCAACIWTASCSSSDKATQFQAGDETLVIGALSDPATLNPLVATTSEEKDIIERIFLKLLDEQDDFLNFRPRLAKSWEFSEDRLAITFQLRDDVRWTDGKSCTAHDVRFTWELQTDTTIAWPYSHLKDRISNVEVIGDHIVTFHFTKRYPYQLMDANDGVIVPKHLMEAIPREQFNSHPFGRRPVGNGPYKLNKWESDQYIELVANPDYYESGKPHLKRVMFRFVPDELTLLMQLKAGEIDCMEAIPTEAAAELTRDYKDVAIYKYPSRGVTYISWNSKNTLFEDRMVRRALTMAIDRKSIIETLLNGMAVECKSPMSPLIWAYDSTIEAIPFDPGEAKRILHEQGWDDSDGDGVIDKEGKPFEFEMMTNHTSQLRVGIATMTQAYLKKIGVKVNIRTLDFSHLIDKIVASDFASCVFGWSLSTKADLGNHWHSSASRPGGYNRVYYYRAEVDSLIDLARNTLDPEAARELWHRCQNIIYEDQPFTFIAIPYEVNGLRSKFQGVRASPISFFINLRDWYVSDPNTSN